VNRTSSIQIRRAQAHDVAGIAEIFNKVLEDRAATFETRPATPENVERWIADDIVIVAEHGSALVGWAKAGPYADRHYYDGVREATLYVAREARRIGVGHALLEGLAVEAAGQGAHKLVGKVFSSNEGSIALLGGLGWREVGVHHRHGELDGEWKDVLVVEKLLEPPD
jgi:L-amino acid N-acyltransferase YncA